ncbi:unnamed protein product, partial [marine sediment metagenome]
ERQGFGRSDSWRKLNELVEDVDGIRQMIGQQPQIDPDFLESLNALISDEFLNRFQTIKAEIERLGRRCVNDEAPISLEEVEDIPEEDFIRLSNGACWDIETLISFIKETVNGQNNARPIKQFFCVIRRM